MEKVVVKYYYFFIIIKIYTALIDIETYNQSVKVSACEGIDRYTYTYAPNLTYNIQLEVYSK